MIAGRRLVVPRPAPWLYLGYAIACYLVAEWVLAGRVGPALDDGWIYLSFARGFVEGDPFSYPGADGPVAAVTAPLWSFVLAAAMFVGGASALTAKVVGVLVLVGVVIAVGRLARAATGDVQLARMVQILVALSPRVVWSGLSGMEAGLGIALLAFGLALHLERRDASAMRWSIAAVVLALAGWSRPESFVFLLCAALHRRRLGALGIAVALTATFPVYHLLVYGFPLPLPFYAKQVPGAPLEVLREQGVIAGLMAGCTHVARQFASAFAMLGAMSPFLLPGLVVGIGRGLRTRNGVPFLAISILAFVVARGSLGTQTPTFQQGRYFVQLWPLFVVVCLSGFDFARIGWRIALAVLAVVGIAFVLDPVLASSLSFDRIDRAFPRDPTRLGLALCWVPAALGVVFALGGAFANRGREKSVPLPPPLLLLGWAVAGLCFGAVRHGQGVRDTFEMNVAMARHVAAEVPSGEMVACHDLGALGWFARRPLLDLAGLANTAVAFAPRDADGRVDIVAILERERPPWLCLTDDMLGKLNPSGRLPAGLATWTEIPAARITSIVNVTVLGDVYRLIRLEWSP